MKKVTILILICSTINLFGQSPKKDIYERTIEVTGVAEMSIPPNEVVFKINLTERMEGKEKITIEKQEIVLKEALMRIGIDAQKDLKVVDLISTVSFQRRKIGEMGSKDYRLTVRDMSLISKLPDVAEQVHVNRLDLIYATHTDLPKFRKETKIEAIKAAKEKAEYMLTAIGQKLGKAVFIQEVNENYLRDADNQDLDPFRGNTFKRKIYYGDDKVEDKVEINLGVKDINLKFSVFVRFEIE